MLEQRSDVVDCHAVVKQRCESSSIVGELSLDPKLYPTKVIDAPPHEGMLYGCETVSTAASYVNMPLRQPTVLETVSAVG